MRIARRFAALAALLAAFAATQAAKAATIVSVTGPADHTYAVGDFHAILAVGFSTAAAYDNVTISAELESVVNSGTAYLMNQIGPGATAANEIATATFNTTGNQTLFTGLTLGAGSYYLVISGTGGQGWDGSDTPAVTTSADVTRGADYFTSQFGEGTPDTSFPPDSAFETATLNMLYSVTGDAAKRYVRTGGMEPDPCGGGSLPQDDPKASLADCLLQVGDQIAGMFQPDGSAQ